jgi:GDPmannose 4,6-dehydratase
MTAIIWGASGQDGFYLKSLLEQEGVDVVSISRSQNFLKIDLTNYEDVCELIKKQKPNYLFHFAANSTAQHHAWKENHDTISTGTIHILEAIKEFMPECKVFLSGSGLQFLNNGQPISENDPFCANSIYSVSRIHTVYAARYYRTLGLKIYVGYFFHHDSPLRSERHINKKIISTAKRISEGSDETLEIGDITVQKEFGFAGDIVSGVFRLVQQDAVFEAVIGTGVAYSIKEWIQICFSLYNLNWQEHVVERKNFIPDFKILVSNPSTMFSIGWKPTVTIDDLAKMMS